MDIQTTLRISGLKNNVLLDSEERKLTYVTMDYYVPSLHEYKTLSFYQDINKGKVKYTTTFTDTKLDSVLYNPDGSVKDESIYGKDIDVIITSLNPFKFFCK